MTSLIFRGALLLFCISVVACKPRREAASQQLTYSAERATKELGLKLIPEILALRNDGDAIPNSVYAQYDTRTIGESLTFRLHQLMEQSPTSGGVAVNWMPDSYIAMAFPHEALQSIFERGFLNQHQLQKSGGGIYAPGYRQEVEDYIIAATIGNAANSNELRAKYGILVINKAQDLGMKSSPKLFRQGFGDWLAVFKPSVELRTTISNRDSLNDYSGARFSEFGSSKRCPRGNFPCRRQMQNTMYGDDVVRNSGEYFEAQIWGKLDIKDVDYFLVPSNTAEDWLTYAKSLGVPVRYYQWTTQDNRESIVESANISNADPVRQAWYEKQLKEERRSPSSVSPPQVTATAPVQSEADLRVVMTGTFTDSTNRSLILSQDGSMYYQGAVKRNAVGGTWTVESATPPKIRIILSDQRKMWYRVDSNNSICFAGQETYDGTAVGSCLARR